MGEISDWSVKFSFVSLSTLWSRAQNRHWRFDSKRSGFRATTCSHPITDANWHLVKQIEEKVDQILAAKQTNYPTDESEHQAHIDRLVYTICNLTQEEIEIVENKQ